mgnify:CR=1 FL=1
MAALPPRAEGGALPRRSASVATDSVVGSTLPRDPEPHPEHITAYGPLHRITFIPRSSAGSKPGQRGGREQDLESRLEHPLWLPPV